MSAADLANDQDRELTVVTAERDDLKLRLDEAEAVIDAVRKVRDSIAEVARIMDMLAKPGEQNGTHYAAKAITNRLNQIDGL